MTQALLLNRRGFLIGASAMLVAPALVRATSLDFIPRPAPLSMVDWEIAYRIDKRAFQITYFHTAEIFSAVFVAPWAHSPVISAPRQLALAHAPPGVRLRNYGREEA